MALPARHPSLVWSTDDEERRRPLRFVSESAHKCATHFHLDLPAIAEFIAEPDEQWVPDSGRSMIFVRGDVAVITGLRDPNLILAVMWRSKIRAKDRSTHTITRDKRHVSAGGGRRLPREHADLLTRLRAAGCTVVVSGGGHYKITHPSTNQQASIAATASDHRAVINAALDCERALGIDLSR